MKTFNYLKLKNQKKMQDQIIQALQIAVPAHQNLHLIKSKWIMLKILLMITQKKIKRRKRRKKKRIKKKRKTKPSQNLNGNLEILMKNFKGMKWNIDVPKPIG